MIFIFKGHLLWLILMLFLHWLKKELSYKNRILIRYIHDEIDEIEKEIS